MHGALGVWPLPGPPVGGQPAGGRRQTCASVGRPSIAAVSAAVKGGRLAGGGGSACALSPEEDVIHCQDSPPGSSCSAPHSTVEDSRENLVFLGPSLNKSLVPLRSPALQGAPSPRLQAIASSLLQARLLGSPGVSPAVVSRWFLAATLDWELCGTNCQLGFLCGHWHFSGCSASRG